MTESHHVRNLLLPELQSELAITRRILAAVPDGHHDFKSAEKSMSLARLAGHTAEMPHFITMTLANPGFDLAASSAQAPHAYESTQQNLAAFDDMADKAVTSMKHMTDEIFDQSWKLSHGTHIIFGGTRYHAYRTFAMNHLIHHRAQLGVYLRLLGVPVPKTYGPSADEM